MSVPIAVTAGPSSYVAILEDAWQAHLAPRVPDAPTVISTFAGAGGSSLGYSMAGFRELLAVEWDDHAVDTFRRNFPDVPVYHGDIAQLTAEAILEQTGLAPGELDVFDGSPPCQGFSMAGLRQLDDQRNQLFREYVRLLRRLRPKAFVMENVVGMVRGRMKLVFAEVMRELKASGYRVSARLMNAMYFHVPQSRERLIFVGVREDLGVLPSHPRALARPITVREALDGVVPRTFGEYRPNPSAQRVKASLSRIVAGKNHAASTGTNRGFNLARLHWDRPAPTIVKMVSLSGQYAGLVHPVEDRLLTIEECKRLSSFPDAFQMVGPYEEQWARLGNSVPPLFMRAIAWHVRRHVLAANDEPRHGLAESHDLVLCG